MFDIKPGDEIDASDLEGIEKARSADALATHMLEELGERIDWIEDFKAYLEGAPLGNEFDVEDGQSFNGLEQLRDMSRNNYAKMVVSATVDRLGILGFRSAVDADEAGDEVMSEAFEADGMGHRAAEAMTLACGYRKSYLYVHPLTKKQRVVPATNGAVISDIDGEPVAAVVLHHEGYRDLDVAEFFFRDIDEDTGQAKGPTYMCVATRNADLRPTSTLFPSSPNYGLKITEYDMELPLDRRIKSGWVWWKSRRLATERIPVTAMSNKDGKNEFEDNTDVLDRINHMIFQRVVIVTMQAFRQRAVKGNFPDTDPTTGARIDYEELFASGPAQMWTLPEDAEIWESSTTDIQGILEAVKNDVRDLATATYTPSTYLSDSGSNSAEGAQLQRENYLSKVEDRKRRFGAKWRRHISILMEAIGETDRADMNKMELIWEPSAVYTLTDQSAAYASLTAAGMAKTTAMRLALSMTPTEIRRAQSEEMEEILTGSIKESLNQGTPLSRSAAGAGATAQTQVAAQTNKPAAATASSASSKSKEGDEK